MSDVLAATAYTTNADMVAAAADLGYIGDRVLDLSYGKGIFWRKHKPASLVTSDGNRSLETDLHIDVMGGYRAEWFDDFDTVVWDGPYRLNGTPDQGDFDGRYGIGETRSWRYRMRVLRMGVQHATAYTKKGGTVLIKCQDQVVSGHKVWQARELIAVAEMDGCRHEDTLLKINDPRKQPEGRSQKHSRSNFSTLIIMRKVFA